MRKQRATRAEEILGRPLGESARSGYSERPFYEALKYVFDLLVVCLALPVVLPVMALAALAIYACDPGPIFFWQERTGRYGRRFWMVKLRTMVRDADARRSEMVALSGQDSRDFKLDRDPRILPVGHFLRAAIIDELPQLWNVVRGELSLVGPRPTSFLASDYEGWHTERLEVRPGLTGLWQISGRADVGFDDRVRLDIRYLEQRSFFYDLWILLATPFAVIFGRGAY